MITSPARESATIYQFPARGRFAADRSDATPANFPRYPKTTIGDGWYHDEAIQEERRQKS